MTSATLRCLTLLPAALLLAAGCAAQPAGAPKTGSSSAAAAEPAGVADSATSVPVAAAEPSGAPAVAGSGSDAAAGPALPAGVRRVIFGTSYKPRSATGVPRCGIQAPLPEPPVFEAGAREVAWVALVDTAVVTSLEGTVVGDSGGELAMEPCEIYAVCGSGACRAQYGAVLRRKDGQPLRPGAYRLEIEVAGQKATLPFEIEAQ